MIDDAARLWEERHTLGEALTTRALALPESPVRATILARAAAMAGRSDEALTLASEAESRLPADDVWRARALETLAITLNELGLDHDAQTFYTQAGEIYETCGDALGQIAVMQNSGTLSWHSHESSKATFLRALELAEQIGHPILVGVIHLNIGQAATRTGDSREERERWIRRGIAILDGAAPDLGLKGLAMLAELHLDEGDAATAADLMRGTTPAAEIATLTTRTTVAIVQARILAAEGQADQAAEVLRDCLREQMHPSHETRLQEQLSTALEDAGDLPGALAAARRAAEIYREQQQSLADRHARALEAWHRTQQLRQQREAAVERADALEQALAERELALAEREETLRELRAAHDRIHELSVRDPLTGLHNRLYLMERAAEALADASADRPGAVAMIDLDHFKRLNDEHGHAAGDRALQDFAALLRRSTGPADLVARYGGEEFVVVRAPGAVEQGGQTLAADLARAVTSSSVDADGRPDPQRCVGASIGVASATSPDLAAALEAADRLMYSAKRAGGSRVVAS